ncbi:hypothetical protein Aab01nite_77970 [Paractinoplanes abujensis]|uniref:Uncharacterized protein n=1 Tax=Paractinoplanes abujensis TaxID=882441 RepID=A0A7W7CS37_9ACTN|nr:hypothetical protein [Actinoplanes abujensis]MBB4692315.1 hypothetical protein [Actinoplanes abujensis]GID24207.1 hypothetical protein Aab01nite_77970 [Actinoplanes abujensis]
MVTGVLLSAMLLLILSFIRRTAPTVEFRTAVAALPVPVPAPVLLSQFAAAVRGSRAPPVASA